MPRVTLKSQAKVIRSLTRKNVELVRTIRNLQHQLSIEQSVYREAREEAEDLTVRVDALEKRELTDHIDCNHCRAELMVTLRQTPGGVNHTTELLKTPQEDRPPVRISPKSPYTQEYPR